MNEIAENFTYKLTIKGGRVALIEGHKGILKYDENSISVKIKRGTLLLNGTSLIIDEINEEEISVKGEIKSFEVSSK